MNNAKVNKNEIMDVAVNKAKDFIDKFKISRFAFKDSKFGLAVQNVSLCPIKSLKRGQELPGRKGANKTGFETHTK